ncbi:hypothetical protein PIB30_046157 [Stylosanthes scabra]|uniref:FAR1 domain-containing protein n=1 Tax=Stylosanthes scabra TaxID=79078 RepID=A0ABU6UI87_9FABA|nr:hypothetical protein [Stylosanthes scabra]
MEGTNESSASEFSSVSESSIQILDDDEHDYIPRAGMTFHTLEDASAFYKEYAKRVGFSTKIRNTNRCKETKEIKNQLITCNREGKWTSEIPCVEKSNPTCGANCPTRIYVHIVKKTLRWCISKVVLNHLHPCCPDQSRMLPQHRDPMYKGFEP